jgi:purine-nucleoside phosphorylase
MSELTPAMIETCARDFAARHEPGKLTAALVAGSGIVLRPAGWERTAEVPYRDIFPFPIHELMGHTPSVSVWRRGGDGVLVFNGRFHLYQGYSAFEVAAIPRLASLLGAPVYVATNASGAMEPDLVPGTLVVVKDHVNLQGANPLVGEWLTWGGRLFPDMTYAYDPELRALALRFAAAAGFTVRDGVYAGVLGPSYETPAEIEMLRRAGCTVVGMSTVQEVIAARHMGMRVLVLALATNPAAGIAGRPLTHEEVIEAGEAAKGKLRGLLEHLLDALGKLPA